MRERQLPNPQLRISGKSTSARGTIARGTKERHGSQCHMSRRKGTAVFVLMVVLLIVGLLVQQSVRTLWTFRRSQQQQLQIAQARELLEIGKQLDKSIGPDRIQERAQSPIIVSVGNQFGRIELLSETGDGPKKSYWIAKLPVDQSGNEILDQNTVTVSYERPTP